MSDENYFTRTYKNLSVIELVEITANQKNYQPLAVKAAQEELEKRNLTSEEINEIKTKYQKENAENDPTENAISEEKITISAADILDDTITITHADPVTEIHIERISVFLIVIFLLNVIRTCFQLYVGAYDDFGVESFPTYFGLFYFFLVMSFSALGAILLRGKKRIGWFLTVFYFSYWIMGLIISVVRKLLINIWDIYLEGTFINYSPFTMVAGLLLVGALINIMFKKNMRAVFEIEKPAASVIVISGMILRLISVFVLGI